MRKNTKHLEILYLETEKCIYISSLTLLVYLVGMIVLNKYPEMKDLIVCTIYLVISFTIILLINSVLRFYNNSYYKVMYIFYGVIAIYNSFKLLPKENLKPYIVTVINNKSFNNIDLILLVMLMCVEISKYADENLVRVKLANIHILFIFVVNVINMVVFNNSWLQLIVVIGTLFLLMKIIIPLKEKNIKSENKVNSILLITYIAIFALILNIILLVNKSIEEYVSLLIQISTLIEYALIVMTTIDKLLDRPYKLLFSDLYNKNLEMDTLNSEVVKKNRELEYSQAVIRKKDKMFKSFFLSVPLPLVIVSGNGRILFVNNKFQELICEENIKGIINKKIGTIIRVKDNRDIQSLLKKTDEIVSGVFYDDEDEKHIDMQFVDISNNEDEILILFNDVTSKIKIEKLKMEMENNKFQEKIKRDFLSNISHDLKTPINVIYSAAQLISVYAKSENMEAIKKYNLVSKLNCIALIRLTNNLIDSSRIYSNYLSANLQVKNIVEVVEEVVTSLVDYAKDRNIDLVFDTDEEEIYVKIDDEFMQRIIINLVSNAIKFSKDEGKIEVNIHDEGEKIKIEFIDNGIGMEEEFVKRAFSRYSMGKNGKVKKNNEDKGTGIGLFVVKKLVEKQGGQISIKSKLNFGTKIVIEFNKERSND